MKIENNCVATINYKLRNANGEVVDSSEDGGPIVMLAGAQDIIPGLEQELMGHKAGDKFEVNIPAEGAYGERDDNLVQQVPRENFPGIESIEPGMMFQTQMEDGQPVFVTVVSANEEIVVVDGNHPMAGQNLDFELEVVDVREATEEEIAHGHVHTNGSSDH